MHCYFALRLIHSSLQIGAILIRIQSKIYDENSITKVGLITLFLARYYNLQATPVPPEYTVLVKLPLHSPLAD